MSLFPAVISSSGTDVPAQDWIFVGQDAVSEESVTIGSLSVSGTSGIFSGLRIIADINSPGTNDVTFSIFGLSNGDYEIERVAASGVARLLYSDNPISYVNLGFTGRHLITVDAFIDADNISGYNGHFTLSGIHIGSPTSYLMTTFRGVFDSGPSNSEVILYGLFNPGSVLRVYGIPKAVTQ